MPDESILPKHLRKFFILGVLEGDGTIGVNKTRQCFVGWCGAERLMNDIRNVIFEELGVKLPALTKNSTIYSITYTRKISLISIINWLYTGSTFRMERKFNKSQEVLNIIK